MEEAIQDPGVVSMAEQVQRQVVVHEPWWLSRVKEGRKIVGIMIGLGLIGYGLYYVGEEYAMATFFAWIVPSTVMFYMLIRVAGPKLVSVDLSTRLVRFLKVPWPLWAKWRKEGEVASRFSDTKGNPVYFCEEVNPYAGQAKFAWVHSLSAIEYVMSAQTFLKLREDFRDKVIRLGELELAFSEQLAKVSEGAIARQVRPLLGPDVEAEVKRVLERLRRMREPVGVVEHGEGRGSQEAQGA